MLINHGPVHEPHLSRQRQQVRTACRLHRGLSNGASITEAAERDESFNSWKADMFGISSSSASLVSGPRRSLASCGVIGSLFGGIPRLRFEKSRSDSPPSISGFCPSDAEHGGCLTLFSCRGALLAASLLTLLYSWKRCS